MKIRIGDRVRIKETGEWGTVIRKMTRYVRHVPRFYVITVDDLARTIRCTDDLEKLPHYRGYPQARDTETAMRHLQEYMK